jgi:uncharacterized circularly permuted ATP-grasp superfamily protein
MRRGGLVRSEPTRVALELGSRVVNSSRNGGVKATRVVCGPAARRRDAC